MITKHINLYLDIATANQFAPFYGTRFTYTDITD